LQSRNRSFYARSGELESVGAVKGGKPFKVRPFVLQLIASIATYDRHRYVGGGEIRCPRFANAGFNTILKTDIRMTIEVQAWPHRALKASVGMILDTRLILRTICIRMAACVGTHAYRVGLTYHCAPLV